MSHEWFLPEGCIQHTGHAVPRRDLTKGSLYRQTLEMLEQSWFTMVSLFPQVSQWEVGNEWNINAFLQPDGFLDSDMSKPFSPEEKLDIAVDLMYFAAKGIRKKRNPRKSCFLFPGAEHALAGRKSAGLPAAHVWNRVDSGNKIYSRIRSGKFWSTDPDDYFDPAAWHPYQMSTCQDKERWICSCTLRNRTICGRIITTQHTVSCANTVMQRTGCILTEQVLQTARPQA